MAKILFISKLFHPHIGGVEKHIYKLSKELIKKKHEISVLTEKYDSKLKTRENYEGINVIRIDYRKVKLLGLFSLWFVVFKKLKLFLKSDVIHVHDVFIWVIPIRMFLFWKPFYLTNHGWEGIYPIPMKNKILKQISTFLSSGSMSIGGYINKFYEIRSNIVSYGGTNIPKKFYKKKEKIVYVGRLEKDTGLDLLLKTLKHFPNLSIEFCGNGSMRQECEKLGEVHGFVNPAKYIKDAKICFCGGYLTILEAFANKCFVATAYSNLLKKSYLLETPFSQWIATGDKPKVISVNLKRKMGSKGVLKQSYEWVKKQTWKELSNKYEEMWKFK